MARKLVGAAVVVAALAMMMPWAFAQAVCGGIGAYPASGTTLQLSKTGVNPGDPVTVSGTDFQPGSQVTLKLVQNGQEFALGTATVGNDGTFSKEVTIPNGVSPGNYVIQAAGTGCAGGLRVLSSDVSVLPLVLHQKQNLLGQLAVTGLNLLPWLLAAIALLLGGGLLIRASRRRAAGA